MDIYKFGAISDIAVFSSIIIMEVLLLKQNWKLRFDFITKYVLIVFPLAYMLVMIGSISILNEYWDFAAAIY